MLIPGRPCTMPHETLHYPDHWYSSFRITSDEGKQLVSISLAIISTIRSLCSTPHRLSHHHAADAGTAPGSDGRTASAAGAAAEQRRFPGIESGLAGETDVDRRFRRRTGWGAKGGAAASDNELAGAVEQDAEVALDAAAAVASGVGVAEGNAAAAAFPVRGSPKDAKDLYYCCYGVEPAARAACIRGC